MCGLVGFWLPIPVAASSGAYGLPTTHGEFSQCVEAMADSLTHRGPDKSGAWVSTEVGIAFAHRRLAVLDSSISGHQPMNSADGQWVIVFNGKYITIWS